MKWKTSLVPVFVALLTLSPEAPLLRGQSADPGWPRIFKQGHNQLTVYQPQVDYWNGFTNIHFRCAIALKGVTKQEKFGVVEIDAVTVADQTARMVALVPTQREVRFPNCSDSELAALRRAADELRPPGQVTTISLDRVIAYLSPAEQGTQHPVEVNLDPPTIFYSSQPAILVIIIGEPQFKPVETNRTDLMFALNTNWDLFYDTVGRRYYLLNQDHWLTASDVKGPWTLAQTLPPSLSTLPANGNWADVRQNIPGKHTRSAPIVFVSTQPAELIITRGESDYTPIKGTQLMRVANTDNVLFMNLGDAKFYFLVAGRWFRASSLDGPWSAASRDLPADFSQIPANDPAAFVKACVPGTREAGDAVLLASIPMTTSVYATNPTVHVVYDGAPQFKTIETTTIQYAVNTPQQVFLVSGKYYCCDAGIWFISSSSAGPWAFCTSVPQVIYTIPPSSPYHNVTYVVVQSSTPTTVVYSQTSGYSGEYVAATGVLMFGAGMLVGAAIANNNSYYYPYPCHYSYGCGATYAYGYGGYYYSGGAAYGPYGGAGYTTSYNPSTGTYSRGAYAYGPNGSAGVQSAYNPSTGAYARSAQVNTAYGSAGRTAGYNPTTGAYGAGGYRSNAYGTAAAGRSYNPYTGTSAAGASASTAYGSASRGAAYNSQTGARAAGAQVNTASGSAGRGAAYNPTTGNAAVGGYASGQYGSAAGITTSQGTGAASWDTANSQGKVAKTQSGDIYASKGDTVYKKDSSGNWSQNSGSGWENTSKPQPQTSSSSSKQTQSQAGSSQQYPSSASSTRSQNSSSASNTANQNRSSMESQAQSRSWGNQQHQSAQSWKSSSASGNSSGASSSRGGRSR